MNNIDIVNNIVKGFIEGATNQKEVQAQWDAFMPKEEPNVINMHKIKAVEGKWGMGFTMGWATTSHLGEPPQDDRVPVVNLSSAVTLTRTDGKAELRIKTEVKGVVDNAQLLINYLKQNAHRQLTNAEVKRFINMY